MGKGLLELGERKLLVPAAEIISMMNNSLFRLQMIEVEASPSTGEQSRLSFFVASLNLLVAPRLFFCQPSSFVPAIQSKTR